MKGRMRPYLPELTIRDYNIYLRYLRGVRRQLYEAYGLYSCNLLRSNSVLFAILSDSLAGRQATCQRKRVPGTLAWRRLMCQTQGIRLAAQVEVLLGWHNLQDRKYSELKPLKRLRRAVDRLLLRRAYKRAVEENPALERLFMQEREQAVAPCTPPLPPMTPASVRACATLAAASDASFICWIKRSGLKRTSAAAATTCSW